MLFSSGYAANIGAIQALVGHGDLVLSDELNHASIIDGCRLSRARVIVYPHADHRALANLLAAHRQQAQATLVVTESLFSMDGDVAPLREIAGVCAEHQAGLMVDEAHALGVFGSRGRGLCHAANVIPDVLVGTLGKAFGLTGAFVAGNDDAVRLVQNRARSFVFSTALPPGIAAAASAAVSLVAGADDARASLLGHAARLRTSLRDIGYRVPTGDGPIIPILVGDSGHVMELSNALFERGVFVHGIRPPTVAPGSSRLRVTPMATHTTEHIDFVINSFSEVRDLYQNITKDT